MQRDKERYLRQEKEKRETNVEREAQQAAASGLYNLRECEEMKEKGRRVEEKMWKKSGEDKRRGKMYEKKRVGVKKEEKEIGGQRTF